MESSIGTGVTANALHPGIVNCNFSAGNGAYGWFMHRYMRLRGVSVEASAATSIYLAASPEIETVSGGYFFDKRIAACAAAEDTVVAARLWQFSEQLSRWRAA